MTFGCVFGLVARDQSTHSGFECLASTLGLSSVGRIDSHGLGVKLGTPSRWSPDQTSENGHLQLISGSADVGSVPRRTLQKLSNTRAERWYGSGGYSERPRVVQSVSQPKIDEKRGGVSEQLSATSLG